MPTDDPNRTALRPDSDPIPSEPAPADGPTRHSAPAESDEPDPGAVTHPSGDSGSRAGHLAPPVPENTPGRLAAALTRTVVPAADLVVERAARLTADARPAGRPTVPGYQIEEELGRGRWGSSTRPGRRP